MKRRPRRSLSRLSTHLTAGATPKDVFFRARPNQVFVLVAPLQLGKRANHPLSLMTSTQHVAVKNRVTRKCAARPIRAPRRETQLMQGELHKGRDDLHRRYSSAGQGCPNLELA